MLMLKNACPVPFDQRPLNEFYALKNSCFFSFFGFNFNTYIYSVIGTSLVSIFIFAPLILAAIKFSWYAFLSSELACMILSLGLILMRLYLGWSYIVDRLFSATVFYEESGWYDGQIWIKTPEMLTKDRLIAAYYVVPLLQRIKLTFVILAICTLIQIALYYLLC